MATRLDAEILARGVAQAPASDWAIQPPQVLTVKLEDDEEVRWHWTHCADGRSMVTGYTIVRRWNAK